MVNINIKNIQPVTALNSVSEGWKKGQIATVISLTNT